ncbi:Down syndrome cell adhesion molecule-like protein Dscam2 [Limulus polyphemus]|uniref:Down syndrome cell adhesion molecule-like protein Dscam2 n=1 Tax=Limulus polyphemus TaxID=6850 RepID=A0ABM1BWE6_LIMPO|nr:Down syndrome cell adhesion molecule-like protein Dscam2 [Limulus polyphemus]
MKSVCDYPKFWKPSTTVQLSYIFTLILLNFAASQKVPRLNPFFFPNGLHEGQRARVVCTTYQGDPPFKFNWFKDGQDLPAILDADIRQLDDYTFSLTIDPVKIHHSGNYTCLVSNHLGSDKKTANLLVTGPPKWLVEPTDATIQAGGTAVVDCKVTGSPAPRVTWKRVRDDLLTTGSLQVANNGSLVITGAQKSQEGMYECSAENGIGVALVKRVRVQILVPPIVEQKFKVITVEAGRDAVLECSVKGEEPLFVEWLKDKKPLNRLDDLSKRSRTEQLPSGEGGIKALLRVSSAQRNDGGLYNCSASNRYGEDNMIIRVVVLEPPSSPSKVEISQIWSRSVRVQWAHDDSGNSPVINHTIEYQQLTDVEPVGKNVTIQGSANSALLRNLQPATAYRLLVRAHNEIGSSQPSESVQFNTASEEPSAPPRNIGIKDVGATFVIVTWEPPARKEWNGPLKGFYVGYRLSQNPKHYTFFTAPYENGTVQFLLRGLQRSSSYSLIVKAFNDVGSSPPSEEKYFRTRDGEPPPSPLLTVVNSNEDSLQLQWNVLGEGSERISGFSLHYRLENGYWNEITISESSQTSYTLTNLQKEQLYHVYVVAHSRYGNSEPSDTITARTSSQVTKTDNADTGHSIHNLDLSETLYIVVPVVAAAVIVVVIAIAICVCMITKRSRPPVQKPYADFSRDPNFKYTATMQRRQELSPPIHPRSESTLKKPPSSAYSTLKTKRSDMTEEPIYETVLDEMKSMLQEPKSVPTIQSNVDKATV